MGLKEGFAERIGWAFKMLNVHEHPSDVTQAELATRVATRLGGEAILTQAAAQGWLSGSVPRDLDTMAAVADELHVPAEWLYFERGPAPRGWEPRLPATDLPGNLPRPANQTGSKLVERGTKSPKRKKA